MGRLPNFLYIGTDKAGSTWIARALDWHPDVYLTPAKDLYYFDRWHARGLGWYAEQFRGARDERIVAEVSHDYLYAPEAVERVAAALPGVRLMACLREPADRAFSAYLYLVQQGLFEGTFEEALAREAQLLERGRYARHLAPWLARFGRGRIHVADFEDLGRDPNRFAKDLFRFLGVEPLDFPEELRGKALPAAKARSGAAAALAKRAALAGRRLGLERIVGRAKSLPLVRRTLYREYGEGEKPRPAPVTVARLRRGFSEEVRALDALLGGRFAERWGYPSA